MTFSNKKFLILMSFFSIAILILIVLITLMLKENTPNQQNIDQDNSNQSNDRSGASAEEIRWMFNNTEWVPSSHAPKCEEPIEFSAPVNLNLASHILYPGQTRGGDYKTHGGFRFDNLADNKVEVTLPFDAVLVSGSRYLEGGERQVILDFISPCGLMIRYDHLFTLSPEFEALMNELPEAKPDDSRGAEFSVRKLYPAGTVVATEIGHKNPFNPGMDFGFYDLRSPNEISQDEQWVSSKINPSMASYARCWLDYLVEEDKAKAYALPGAGTEGKVSDYCE